MGRWRVGGNVVIWWGLWGLIARGVRVRVGVLLVGVRTMWKSTPFESRDLVNLHEGLTLDE